MTITLTAAYECTCGQCAHQWLATSADFPERCPHCGSSIWNIDPTERIVDIPAVLYERLVARAQERQTSPVEFLITAMNHLVRCPDCLRHLDGMTADPGGPNLHPAATKKTRRSSTVSPP